MNEGKANPKPSGVILIPTMISNKTHLLISSILINFYTTVFFSSSSSFIHLVSPSPDYSSPYAPHNKIFLNCGSSGRFPDGENRTWTGDIGSKFAPSTQNTIISNATSGVSRPPSVPFNAARLSNSQFSYYFPVGRGRKFIRLYFHPSNYGNRTATESSFSVTASGNYTLLKDFSPSQVAKSQNSSYLVQEYLITVPLEFLNLTFIPSPNLPNSYAFVNGIEIVSMPDIFNLSSSRPQLVGYSQTFTIESSTALETVYRLNVGGNSIPPARDSGLYRAWQDDSNYMFGARHGVTFSIDDNVAIKYSKALPEYIAPPAVYESARSMGMNPSINLSYNLTWIFPVDAGFYYLLRLHFCEIQYPFTMVNMRVFNIYINGQMAEERADVIAWSGGIGVPWYQEYVVMLASGVGRQALRVELHPDTRFKPQYYDAILNGLEIFKLTDYDGNLASSNPIGSNRIKET